MIWQILFICVSYLISATLFWLYLKRLNYTFLRVGRWTLGFGVALHWGVLVSWFVKTTSFVPANGFERGLVILAIAGLLTWALSVRKNLIFFITFALPFICLGLGIVASFGGERSTISLPNPWLWTHIVLSVLGDAFLFLASLVSLAYLTVEFQLRRRIATNLVSRLPSLADFDIALGESLLAGFVLLTLGLVIGMGFAEKYWSDDWYLDSKIIFSVLVWLLYALVLGLRRISPAYRGRRSALFSLIGFLAILLVSLNMPSSHHAQTRQPDLEKNSQ